MRQLQIEVTNTRYKKLAYLSFILCMYCNNETPMTASVIDFEYYATGAYATAFFICPDCQNKFVVKIQDLGKVTKE
jgi:hypothetical protein